MREIVVLGCGYVGERLVKRLVGGGDTVHATTTTEAKSESIASWGAEPHILRTDDPHTFEPVLGRATHVIHLAPTGDGDLPRQTAALADACTDRLRRYVYGSTTGAFGNPVDPADWIDETTPSRDVQSRGARRLEFERGLRAAGLPLAVVRIAGIYGPDRTLLRSIEANRLTLFEDGPPTSRIHADDLARLLETMMADDAPPLAIGCDEEPAPTLEVARYTCGLVGREAPIPITIDAAKKVMSDAAIEMRMGGRRCRSLVREKLMGALAYPTYREGVKASLVADGVL